MSHEGEAILQAALKLSWTERSEIVDALLASLGPEEALLSDADFRAELDRR